LELLETVPEAMARQAVTPADIAWVNPDGEPASGSSKKEQWVTAMAHNQQRAVILASVLAQDAALQLEKTRLAQMAEERATISQEPSQLLPKRLPSPSSRWHLVREAEAERSSRLRDFQKREEVRREQNYSSHVDWVQARARQHNEFIAKRHSEFRREQNTHHKEAQNMRAAETRVKTASERVKEQRMAHSEWISCNTRVRQRIRDLNAKAIDEKIRARNEKLERKHDAARIDNALLNAREQFGRKRLEMALIRETTRQQAVRLANVRHAEHLRVAAGRQTEGSVAQGSIAFRHGGSSSPRELSTFEGGPEVVEGPTLETLPEEVPMDTVVRDDEEDE